MEDLMVLKNFKEISNAIGKGINLGSEESRTWVNFIPRSAIKAKSKKKGGEISEELVNMVSQLRFDGSPTTDPYLHLEEFEDMCDIFKTKTSVNSQGEENLTKAWVRYKALLLKLPNHGFGQKEVIEFFYNGLTVESRLVLDTSSGGIFSYRTVKEAYQLLEDMVLHHLDWTPEAEEE
ncbi:hypothetical protein OSB04_019644 [Centaurea solstitialis]|uniref:Uncharacterized protein n=1 Tax=Centaurea solstitialis TaxID=347529 RepID=A0AA38WG36_9ASTR|nr:hypothetical protein OSB04_019644 [Centaurea solstitialis]